MLEIVMPKLGLTMEKGRIVKWLKKEGDKVAQDEALVEIETEKVTMSIESTADGILGKILAQEGAEVEVSKPIAILISQGEQLPESIGPSIAEPQPTLSRVPAPQAEPASIEKKMRISPLARKLAREHGIDLSKIIGTGPDGRVVKEDLLKVAQAVEEMKKPSAITPSVTEQRPSITPLPSLRREIAERMTISAKTVPQVTLHVEVDATEATKLHEAFVEEAERTKTIRVGITHMILRAVAKTLREFPMFNSFYENDHLRMNESVNIGVAVAVEDGLIVPVVHDADKLSLIEGAKKTEELIDRARAGDLSLRDVEDGTFTISNLGMFGIESFTPLINPPQSGILGVGKISKKPVVINDQITVRSRMFLSLTFDHRVVDGSQAAQFLKRVKELLENADRMLV